MLISRRHFSLVPFSSILAAGGTRMSIQLSCGSIGVKADQRQAIDYAAKYGFECVDADSGYLASLDRPQLSELLAEMKSKNVKWGSAGLPVDFRRDDETFRQGVTDLPRRAAALRAVGVTRVGTWIGPSSNTLTFTENMRLHAERLRLVASVLADQDCRLGLEYVGPKTSWSSGRFPFVHTMKETKELIAAIGKPNVGILLDSWHWFTAQETVEDLKTLTNNDIVAIDLNDAPAGIPVIEQKDNARALPCETGVIDMKAFLSTLSALGCDAPARCEPFSARLRALPPEQALAETAAAMKKAFALIV